MIKSDFVELYAARLGITATEAERNVNMFTSMIYEQLRNGDKVQISGFGTFSVSHRMPRVGVNPRNPKELITLPELNTPKFKAGEAFKNAVKLRK